MNIDSFSNQIFPGVTRLFVSVPSKVDDYAKRCKAQRYYL